MNHHSETNRLFYHARQEGVYPETIARAKRLAEAAATVDGEQEVRLRHAFEGLQIARFGAHTLIDDVHSAEQRDAIRERLGRIMEAHG